MRQLDAPDAITSSGVIAITGVCNRRSGLVFAANTDNQKGSAA